MVRLEFGQWTYLVWLALCIGLPLLGCWWRWGALIWQKRRALGWALAGALVGGWLWDGLAIQFGVWYYSPDKIIGWWLLGMPIEEWIWIAGVTLLFGSVTVGLMGAVE
jgi:lycopene cyclase domain-containing protein